MEKIPSTIEAFVDCYLADAKDEVRGPKVIHECTWGTNLYDQHEIVFLDTPLVQRLRDIRQTGLDYLTFPTAEHTRFDHTLGTITQCAKFADRLMAKKGNLLGSDDIRRLRLAALFHDLGHCFFSHASEEIYALLPQMQDEISKGKPYETNAPHEVLTAKILDTESFKQFFHKVITKYNIDCNLDQIKALILGQAEPLDKYKADFINGPFDADKIDYLFRDGHFSGIPLVIDLDRLWYSTDIGIIRAGDGRDWRRLVIDYTGTSPIEQIFFDRVQLYPALYHHQKARAALCMFKGIIEYIRTRSKNGISIGRRRNVKFDNLADFLWGSELDFFAIATQTTDEILHRLVHDLQYRRLLKRAIILSRNTLVEDDGFRELISFRHQYNPRLHTELRSIALDMCKEAKKKGIDCDLAQVWIDLPAVPRVPRDIDRAYIQFPGGNTLPMTEVFPISQWLELYGLYKWQGHVFVPAGKENDMAGTVYEVLRKRFGLKAKPEAFTRCHVHKPPELT